jgi:hypothetical protein
MTIGSLVLCLEPLATSSLPLTPLPHWDQVPVTLAHAVLYIEAPFARDTLEFSLWFSLARCVVPFVVLAYINFGFPLQESHLAVLIVRLPLQVPDVG